VPDSGFASSSGPKPTNCSDPDATMEVASVGGANAPCPDGKGRAETDYTTLFWDDATICFAGNFVEGDCYAVDTSSEGEGAPFTHTDCADSRALIKVVKRFDGLTTESLCETGTKPIAYVAPARLYCLEPAHP
jgi:hypothetical protein